MPHLLYYVAGFPSKYVVNDACARCVVVQSRQQGMYAPGRVSRVQRSHFFIRQLSQLREQLRKIAAHVGVRAIPHIGIRHLRRHSKQQNVASC
jgi:hypothetical protein